MRRQEYINRAGPYAQAQMTQQERMERDVHGLELRKIILGLYITESISSRKLCTIAHHHTLNGGTGMEDFARPPNPKDNNHNSVVRLVLAKEFGDSNLTFVEAPMHDKKKSCRSKVMIPIVRPSESLSEHFLGHTNAVDVGDLALPLPSAPELPPTDEWTPAHRDSEVCKVALASGVHPTRIRRLGIFMDAAGFTKQESFEGLFVIDLDTGFRTLVAVIRKAEYCSCGCRGFCTLWPVHDAILNDLQSAADGKWSVVTHLQEEFPPGSVERARAGLPMGLVLAVCELRADMPGYTGPMGFRASSHAVNPCCVCNICKGDLSKMDNVSLTDGPAEPFTTEQYRQLMRDCSVVATVTEADVRSIIRHESLEYDRRKMSGFLGRRMVHHVILESGQRLLLGDRLHPSRTLQDVADFELQATPFTCRFWRVGNPKTARLLHHSPLKDIPGVGMQTYAIDILHTWHLGGIPKYNGKVLWAILRSNAYAGPHEDRLYQDDRMHLKLLRLRSDLWLHYKEMQRLDPEWRKKASQVWNLSIKMLGKEWDPVVRTKASESRHLLDFCVRIAEMHQDHLDQLDPNLGKYLLLSGKAAQQVNDIIRDSPRVMSVPDQQRLMDSYLRHCTFFCRAGGSVVPKHHLMIHCIQRISYLGNPRFYSCYHDESLNGVVVEIAKSCHRMTFMRSVHDKFRWAGKLGLSMHMF